MHLNLDRYAYLQKEGTMKRSAEQLERRGARRTVEAFATALMELVQRKSFESISVRELCDRADYPRATFYNYFDDKFDLLDFCWQRLDRAVDLPGMLAAPGNQAGLLFFDRICDLIDDRADELQAIARNNPATGYFFTSFLTGVSARARQVIEAGLCTHTCSVDPGLMAEHWANTLLLVLSWKYLRGRDMSREEAREALLVLVGHL